MPLFRDSKDYGGKQTVEFKKSDEIVYEQISRLIREKRAAEAAIVNFGLCAAFSLNWLEFYCDKSDSQFDVDALENKGVIDRIIESQIYLRHQNLSLYQFLPQFGPSLIDICEDFKEEEISNLLMKKSNIITISFQSQIKGNHSAVAIISEEKSKKTFRLYDGRAGEVLFEYKVDNLQEGKNVITWLKKYFNSYRNSYNDPSLKIVVGNYKNEWLSKTERDSNIEIMRTYNKHIRTENTDTTPPERINTSDNLYVLFHQTKSNPKKFTVKSSSFRM